MMKRMRDEVEAHVELPAGVVEGLEAAFVGRQLFAVRPLGTGNQGDRYDQQSQADGDAEEDQDRQVFGQQRLHAQNSVRRPTASPGCDSRPPPRPQPHQGRLERSAI